VFKEDSVQIPTQRSQISCSRPDGLVMRSDAHQCREASNSSRLHPSRRHGNTFGHSLEFEKIPTFLYRHEVGRQLVPIQRIGQHCPNVEILDKEIACIHSAWVRMTGQHHPDVVFAMAITCKKSASIRTLGQHRPDAALILKLVKRVIESRLHKRPSGHSMLPSGCRLEKLEIDSF
jgi:hypothetical protein